uniref:BESS domain-containing protein n=1 Tax=Clastoptera arizonana TaxID=38151 RepID=A0A1B6E3K1_9HEMI
MFFIDSSIALGPTEASPIVSQTLSPYHSDEAEELEAERNVNTDEEHSFSSMSTVFRRRKQRLESKIENYIDSYEKAKQYSAADECDDLNFLKSLLPLVKPLPIHKKIKLRMDFMKIAYEYSLNSSTEIIAPPMSITTPTPRSNDASTSTTTQITAQQLPSDNNWFQYPTSKQSQVHFKLQLNHTVTSNIEGKTEGKKYHDLQPMRPYKTIEMKKEGPSPPDHDL